MAAPSATCPAPLGWRSLCVYAGPALAAAGPGMYLQFYFLSFATDVLLLAPASVGAIVAAGRVWDAITDPLAGSWSDRTRSRVGRRRIWMLGGLGGGGAGRSGGHGRSLYLRSHWIRIHPVRVQGPFLSRAGACDR